MILPPAGLRVLMATRPEDFRRGAYQLAAVTSSLPLSGKAPAERGVFNFACQSPLPRLDSNDRTAATATS
jgi:hypothetical protein